MAKAKQKYTLALDSLGDRQANFAVTRVVEDDDAVYVQMHTAGIVTNGAVSWSGKSGWASVAFAPGPCEAFVSIDGAGKKNSNAVKFTG